MDKANIDMEAARKDFDDRLDKLKAMSPDEFKKEILAAFATTHKTLHYMAIGADNNHRMFDRLMCKLADISLVIAKKILDDETQDEIQKILNAEEYPTLTQKLAEMRESAPQREMDSVNPLKLLSGGKDDVKVN